MYDSNEINMNDIRNKCFLKDAQIYIQDGSRYLKLVYEYEDSYGIHELTIPQVEFPFGNRLNLTYICENNPKSCNYISWNKPKVGEKWKSPDK